MIQRCSFAGCSVFICDFHREQAWERWLKKKINGFASVKQKVIALFRRIAHSETITDSEKAIEDLQNSEYWKNGANLREYFTKTWLKNKEVRKALVSLYIYTHYENGCFGV